MYVPTKLTIIDMSIRTSPLMHLELLFNHEKRRAAASKELRALRSFPPLFG